MKMTKRAKKDLLNTLKQSYDETIQEILSDKENPNSFDSIKYNDDFTKFTVKVDASKYDELESFFALTFCIMGNLYQSIDGAESKKINTVVEFVNKDTKETITTIDSSAIENSENVK